MTFVNTRIFGSTFKQPPTLQTLKGCRNCMRMVCPVSPCWQPLCPLWLLGGHTKVSSGHSKGIPPSKDKRGEQDLQKTKVLPQKSPSLPCTSKEAVVPPISYLTYNTIYKGKDNQLLTNIIKTRQETSTAHHLLRLLPSHISLGLVCHFLQTLRLGRSEKF